MKPYQRSGVCRMSPIPHSGALHVSREITAGLVTESQSLGPPNVLSPLEDPAQQMLGLEGKNDLDSPLRHHLGPAPLTGPLPHPPSGLP
ncbi:hypothetical protein QC763_0069200 [Podospora pseudopauciseta]|uniref:Uncharacterized protein n=1 Tax=Podospora pseudopauciseta TaxID=2093780 RepID=A0ABR0HDE0_9PEZI|nr:hypothetical protein QC763_0069200 [Podospora pseudopauciseta]